MAKQNDGENRALSRRQFLTLSGAGLAGGVLLIACGDDDGAVTTTTGAPSTTGASTTAGPTTTGAGPTTAGPTTTGGVVPTQPPQTGNPLIDNLPPVEGHTVIWDGTQRSTENPGGLPAELKESPTFAAMVAAGTLPPVAERIGMDPLVIAPVHGIGTYGGKTLETGHLDAGDFVKAIRMLTGPDGLFVWDYERKQVVPNIAKGFEFNADGTELIIHLRNGMRWSDGEPFTADDIVGWRTEIDLNDAIRLPVPELRVADVNAPAVAIDQYTVSFQFAAPAPLVPALMSSWTSIASPAYFGRTGAGGYAPMHYLRQFLPSSVGEAAATAAAQGAGFDTWVQYLFNRNDWSANAELPAVTPWRVTRPINDPPWTFEANPYSIWVDNEGNQLPYIHDVRSTQGDNRETIILRVLGGEIDFQARHLDAASTPVLIDGEADGGYKIHLTPAEEMDYGLRLNLAWDGDPVITELLQDVNFRRAVSMSIQRDQVNEAFFLGTSTPTSIAPSDNSAYALPAEWRTKWATHDLEMANQLLDDLGLTARDGNGYRMRPDGNGRIELDYKANVSFADFPAVGEMVASHLADAGIFMAVEETPGNLLVQFMNENSLMIAGHQTGTDDPFLKPDNFLPVRTEGFSSFPGRPFAQWFASGGAVGTEPPAHLRLHEGMDLYYRGLQETSLEARNEIGKQLYMLHVDMVWSVGVIGFGLAIYGMFAANNNLRNVPGRILNTLHQKTPTNALQPGFYWA